MSLLQEIPASPFRVKVDPSHDASKVKAEGPGLSKAGKVVAGKAASTFSAVSGTACVLSRPRVAYYLLGEALMWQPQCVAGCLVVPSDLSDWF